MSSFSQVPLCSPMFVLPFSFEAIKNITGAEPLVRLLRFWHYQFLISENLWLVVARVVVITSKISYV